MYCLTRTLHQSLKNLQRYPHKLDFHIPLNQHLALEFHRTLTKVK